MSARISASLFGAALALIGTAAGAAEAINSANYMMPHCRSSLASEHLPDTTPQAFCLGVVRGIVFMGSTVLRDQVSAERDRGLPCIDPPSGTTPRQSVQVVVAYIEARPA